jgi:hypothetical protein
MIAIITGLLFNFISALLLLFSFPLSGATPSIKPTNLFHFTQSKHLNHPSR